MDENAVKLSDDNLALLEAVLDREQTVNASLREQLQWNAKVGS